MNVKCRGYEGMLLNLDSYGNMLPDGKFYLTGYEITLLSPDGIATIKLGKVQKEEIEIV